MTSLATKVELQFGARCGRPPSGVHFVPGRLVVLGEHLDHQGGPVLAAPLEQGVACAWALRPDSRVVVWSMNARQKDSFQPHQVVRSGRAWADLARGAYARVASTRRRMPGLDLMVEGDLPMGAGLASSAAYLVALLRSLHEAVGEYRSRWELSADVPAIERAWVDVACGPMDPYVVAVAKRDEVLRVDCRTLEHEVLRLPDGYELVAEDTGVRRVLRDTPYNVRRTELSRALASIRTERPELESLCDLEPDAFQALASQLEEVPRKRARHVVTETARVRAATEALLAGDMQALGTLMLAGHRSLAVDFESSLPAIDALVELAVARPSILGARLQGAGWGGRLAVLQREPGARARASRP